MKSAPEKFWRYLSKPMQTLSHIILGDKVIHDDNKKAQAFSRFFQSVFSRSTCAIAVPPPDLDIVDGNDDTIPEVVFSEDGIFSLFFNLDPKKAGGPDDIPVTFLRRYSEWITKYLIIIFEA